MAWHVVAGVLARSGAQRSTSSRERGRGVRFRIVAVVVARPGAAQRSASSRERGRGVGAWRVLYRSTAEFGKWFFLIWRGSESVGRCVHTDTELLTRNGSTIHSHIALLTHTYTLAWSPSSSPPLPCLPTASKHGSHSLRPPRRSCFRSAAAPLRHLQPPGTAPLRAGLVPALQAERLRRRDTLCTDPGQAGGRDRGRLHHRPAGGLHAVVWPSGGLFSRARLLLLRGALRTQFQWFHGRRVGFPNAALRVDVGRHLPPR